MRISESHDVDRKSSDAYPSTLLLSVFVRANGHSSSQPFVKWIMIFFRSMTALYLMRWLKSMHCTWVEKNSATIVQNALQHKADLLRTLRPPKRHPPVCQCTTLRDPTIRRDGQKHYVLTISRAWFSNDECMYTPTLEFLQIRIEFKHRVWSSNNPSPNPTILSKFTSRLSHQPPLKYHIKVVPNADIKYSAQICWDLIFSNEKGTSF